ncbi:MAG TPA: zinc ABC transporter substrate-binding protein [Acetobacteraceae bacterium]|nr:zinc ABC transporter substrate-binding protein [Acetobacteraceae bacterium]
MRLLPSLAALAVLLTPVLACATAVSVVAAENVYGDVARQIGGRDVTVRSILQNPDQDPHLFEVTPSAARAVSAADILVLNGLGYDPWMATLLHATPRRGRIVLDAGALAHRKTGDNPHIWYDTTVMLRAAAALAGALQQADPAHAAGYRQRLAVFRQAMQPVQARIAVLHARLAGLTVTATEPVFGDMLKALGMTSRNMGFQLAVMNNTEPSASQVADFETDLRQHRVRLLVYNSQAVDPIATHMRNLAVASHIPVVGVTETEPPGMTYQAWMLAELDAVARAVPD